MISAFFLLLMLAGSASSPPLTWLLANPIPDFPPAAETRHFPPENIAK
jgi:hypothetical protein